MITQQYPYALHMLLVYRNVQSATSAIVNGINSCASCQQLFHDLRLIAVFNQKNIN
jgi:hypothetical protein